MEAFQASFTKTFADLNRARDYQLRQNTRKNFNINDLNPKNLQKVFFWKRSRRLFVSKNKIWKLYIKHKVQQTHKRNK